MFDTSQSPVTERQILIVGPYGVLGTGVIDAKTFCWNGLLTTELVGRSCVPIWSWDQA
jgi:hypothetical protein